MPRSTVTKGSEQMKDPAPGHALCSFEAYDGPYGSCPYKAFVRCGRCGKPYCFTHAPLSPSGQFMCSACASALPPPEEDDVPEEPSFAEQRQPDSPPAWKRPRWMTLLGMRLLVVGAVAGGLGLLGYYEGFSSRGGWGSHVGQGNPIYLVVSAIGGILLLVGVALLVVAWPRDLE